MYGMAIEVSELWQAYQASWILKDISFNVQSGEIAVLTGVNGVGKTTLLTTIAGLKSPVRGRASVFGNLRRVDPDQERAARNSVVFLPDDVFLPPNTTVKEYLAAAASLFDVDEAAIPDRIDSLLRLLALDTSANQAVRSLSAGQKKKVGIAGALLSDRPLMLLDEPFSGGLDPAGIMAVRRVLKHRAATLGQTILMTTPVIELVTELADRLIVLRNGQLAHNLTREEITASVPSNISAARWLENLVFPNVHNRIEEYVGSLP